MAATDPVAQRGSRAAAWRRRSRGILRALIPVIVAVAAAWVSSLWLQRLAEPPPAPAADDRRLPDYWMEGVERTALDEAGAVASVLTAERLEHYPFDGSSELVRPRLALYNGATRPWFVVAEHAWASGDGEVVRLNGPVEIFRRDDEGARSLEVETFDLKVLPREKYAETAREATITGPQTVTTGVGLRANFSVNRLELLGKVRTRHEPRSHRNPAGPD